MTSEIIENRMIDSIFQDSRVNLDASSCTSNILDQIDSILEIFGLHCDMPGNEVACVNNAGKPACCILKAGYASKMVYMDCQELLKSLVEKIVLIFPLAKKDSFCENIYIGAHSVEEMLVMKDLSYAQQHSK